MDWYEPGILEKHSPDPSKPFMFQINLSIGTEGGEGTNLFIVTVCNMKWLEENVTQGTFGFSHFIVKDFVYSEFEDAVVQFLTTCKGSTWTEMGLAVSRIGDWEYDYLVGRTS